VTGRGGSTDMADQVKASYRVAQWATGNIGTRALKGVIEHPHLSLAGVLVYAPEKAGMDAGALCGLGATGVSATTDVDEIVALGADCVLYMPRATDLDDVCRLLASGSNVVTTRGDFHHPGSMGKEARARVEAACLAGGTSIHSTGSSPGFISEAVPFALSSIQRELDQLVIEEFADLSKRNSPELLFDLMGFGTDPATFDPNRWSHGAASFGPTLRLLADAVGLPLDEVLATGEVAVARQTTEIAAGTLAAGTVAAQRMRVTGLRHDRPLLTFIANWYCSADVEPAWDLGDTGWRLTVAGDAPLNIEMRFAVPLEEMGDYSPGYTANRAVNAVGVVCEAAPGIRTSVDLPQIIGTLREKTA
jgi:2,4-diaminopentanoate dehydrogenase